MKKLLYVCLLIGSYAAFVLYVQLNASSPIGTPPIVIDDDDRRPVPVPTPVPASVPVPTPVQQTGLYRNGTYTGAVADAYYGNVQMQVTISGGRISNVQFLDHPQDRSRSVQINNYAMPLLKSEAIQAQSANVDIVSGATATSEAFIQSLASALTQAKT